MNEIGMKPMITEFQQKYIWPIVAWLLLLAFVFGSPGSREQDGDPGAFPFTASPTQLGFGTGIPSEAKVLFPEQAKSCIRFHPMPPSSGSQMTTVGIVSEGGGKVCSDNACPVHKFQGLRSSDAPVHVLLPEGSQFDDHHSFIVRYTASEDLGLDMHTDDSAPCLHFRYSRIP